MSTIKDGGPAFPVEVDSTHPAGRQTGNTLWQSYGMSLRDYFAAKAMQGFAADPNCAFPSGTSGMARNAYEWADAMLKAREGGAS